MYGAVGMRHRRASVRYGIVRHQGPRDPRSRDRAHLSNRQDDALLNFPFPRPEPGQITRITDDLLWLRLPLPFTLDHINVYLLEQEDGWVVYDTGIGDDATKATWERVQAEHLGGKPFSRVIVSHYHPDHIGLAGWFSRHHGLPVMATLGEFLTAQVLCADTSAEAFEHVQAFYRAAGLDTERDKMTIEHTTGYRTRLALLPVQYSRLQDGQTLSVGGHEWEVITAGGHSNELAMLYCRARDLLLAADQIIAKISPNISIFAGNPGEDALGHYLASLKMIRERIADSALVMPAHNLPFYGLHERTRQLEAHHQTRLDALLACCREKPCTPVECFPAMFSRPILNYHDMRFAVGEVIAHVNYLTRRGRLALETGDDGLNRYRSVD
jgi:glyoxylase-like metal-dependent hydrolase (beta-lactamase superfamily II)